MASIQLHTYTHNFHSAHTITMFRSCLSRSQPRVTLLMGTEFAPSSQGQGPATVPEQLHCSKPVVSSGAKTPFASHARTQARGPRLKPKGWRQTRLGVPSVPPTRVKVGKRQRRHQHLPLTPPPIPVPPFQPGLLLRLFLEPKSLTREKTFNLFLSQLVFPLLGLLTHLHALDFSRSRACRF